MGRTAKEKKQKTEGNGEAGGAGGGGWDPPPASPYQRTPLQFELRDQPLQRVFRRARQAYEFESEREAPIALCIHRMAVRHELHVERNLSGIAEMQFDARQ